ncbi:MAG: type IV toxin-antitoxin system AbiEi family antitoxin domain-containing protein [Sedimentisphaerales bacterium]|jgi:predicted transcriptional regulator of viral defense system|nr:type IV toxin-antitoxin system AbiEi family antitoxin domain-containing protein [Sedimentisphaerales bacterium]
MRQIATERCLYEIAERQAGYFSAGQGRQVGLSKSLLSHHVKSGHFVRIRRGVYRLALFPETPHADLYIAWLSTGGRGVLSHETALALYGLTDLLPREIHLTVPRTASRRLKGICFHTAKLAPQEVTWRQGLPVTTLPRTISDLIRFAVPAEWIRQAIQQALARGLTSEAALEAEARQRGGAIGAQIREALESRHEVRDERGF